MLNTGFSAGAAAADAIDARAVAPAAASTGLVAYARLIGLEAGDILDLRVTGPDGRQIAVGSSAPMDHDKAWWLIQAGQGKPPAGGWPHGAYTAELAVRRAGAVAVSARWRTTL